MSEIKSYFEMWRIDEIEQRDRIMKFVTILDNKFLEFTREELKRKAKQK